MIRIAIGSVVARGMTARVVRGGLWSLGGQAASLGASLLATPFTIRLLGPEGYGVLALINLLIGYLAFTDLGMGAASTKFGAEAHARGDDEGEAAVVWTALLITLLPALIGTMALLLGARPLAAGMLRVPASLQDATVLALRLAALGFFARCLSGVLNTPQLTRLRMDLNAAITTGTTVAQIGLVPVILACGGGLAGAAAVITAMGVTALLLHAATSGRLLPNLSRPRFRFEFVGPMVRFGGPLVISSLAVAVLSNVERLLLARFGSLAAVAHYAVAHSLSCILILIPYSACQTLMPAFSLLRMSDDPGPLQRLYNRSLKINMIAVPLLVLLTCVVAKPFFTLWAGPEYGRESTLPFLILSAGVAVNSLAYTPFSLIMAAGRSGVLARFHVAELIIFIPCAAALCYWFGAVGAAVACGLRAGVDALFMCVTARRISGVSFAPLADHKSAYFLAVASLVLAGMLAGLFREFLAFQAAAILSGVIVYLLLIWYRVLTPEENSWLKFRIRPGLTHAAEE